MPGEIKLKSVTTIDGYTIETTDLGAQALEVAQKRIKDANDTNLKLVSDHAGEMAKRDTEIQALKDQLAKKDGELGTRDAEIKTLKDQVSDASKIDQLVSERTDLLSRATSLGLTAEDCKGKTNEQVISEAVKKNLGDASVKDKSADYVRCAFDFLCKDKGNGGTVLSQDRDPIADGFRAGVQQGQSGSVADAYRDSVNYLENAWRNPVPGQMNDKNQVAWK